MPSTVKSLSEEFGLTLSGPVKWGQRIPSDETGVYFVCLTGNPSEIVCEKEAPIDIDAVNAWLDKVSCILLDGHKPTSTELAKRLSKFWLRDETIVYIGKSAQPLRKRVNQYYNTPLGHRGPHAGGHWLKTLSNINQLYIFWAETSNPEEVEEKLLRRFSENISEKDKENIYDNNLPLPFANLEINKKQRKKHGITRSKLK